MILYRDAVTFVTASQGNYRGSKAVATQHAVNSVFLQNTGFNQSNFQEAIDADAICYPDPTTQFIIDNSNRLEGMYILAPLYSGDNVESWYKIVKVRVNRDHLLTNTIDNIECQLKKTSPLGGIS